MRQNNKVSGEVANVFASYSGAAQAMLLEIRRLIFETAAENDCVGPITETLKWGEPAYLTEKSKSGSTIRLAWRSSRPDECLLFFNCKTTLVSDFRKMFGDQIHFEGNREMRLCLSEALPLDIVKACIGAALSYHLDKA